MAEDRDPARGDNERYQDDPSDRAVELKKKFEEERKSKEPSEERAPEMVYDDDNESPEDQADDRYIEDMRDRDRAEKKKLEEERRSKDPSDRDPGRSGDLFDPESSERIQPF
jgi:hypothetical protein